MKIRKSFVTNSSSSSYICDICGEQFSGWDASLSDFDLVECVNGHVFCMNHSKNLKEPEETEDEDYNYDWRYKVKEEFCPVCSFQTLIPTDGLKFLMKKMGIKDDDILTEMKNMFSSYREFKKS